MVLTRIAILTAAASEVGQTIIVQVTGYGLNVPPTLNVIAGHIATAAFLARLVAGLAIKQTAVSESKFEKLSDPAKAVEPVEERVG